MSFTQNTHGENNTPVVNTGHMNMNVNHDNRTGGGDTISFGNVGTVGNIGGSNNQSTVYSGAGGRAAANAPTTAGIYSVFFFIRVLKYLIF